MKYLNDHVKFEPTKWGVKATLTVTQELDIGTYDTEDEIKEALKNELREYICDLDCVRDRFKINQKLKEIWMRQYIDLFGNLVEVEDEPVVDEKEIDVFMNHVKEIHSLNGDNWLFRLIRQMKLAEMRTGNNEEKEALVLDN